MKVRFMIVILLMAIQTSGFAEPTQKIKCQELPAIIQKSIINFQNYSQRLIDDQEIQFKLSLKYAEQISGKEDYVESNIILPAFYSAQDQFNEDVRLNRKSLDQIVVALKAIAQIVDECHSGQRK